MSLKVVFCVMFVLSSTSVDAQGSISDNVALFWNLYDSVVRGSRILHDVSEGVGAVSKAMKAIDNFLDTSNEDELAESIKADLAAGGDPTAPTAGEADVTKTDTIDSTATNTCDAKNGQPCPQATTAKPAIIPPDPDISNFDGCGALGFHIKDANLPVAKLLDCCSVHTACYSLACRVNKRDCDSKLRNCFFQVCDAKTIDKNLQKSCRSAAKLLFSGTMALSFQQYNDAQQKLDCPGKNSQRRRNR